MWYHGECVHFVIGIHVAQDPLVWQVLDLMYAFSSQTLKFFILFTGDSMALLIMSPSFNIGMICTKSSFSGQISEKSPVLAF